MFPEDEAGLLDLKRTKSEVCSSVNPSCSANKTRSPESKSSKFLMKPICKCQITKRKTEYAKRTRKLPDIPKQSMLLLDSPSTNLERTQPSQMECHVTSQVRDEFFEQLNTQDDNSINSNLLACREKVYH